MLGGDASYINETNTINGPSGQSQTTHGSTLNLSPTVGYFIRDRFSLGIKMGYQHYRNVNQNSVDQSSVFGLGPFVRYYFLPIDKSINIFGQLDYSYSTSNPPTPSVKVNIYSLALGTVIFLNSSVGVEFAVSYSLDNTIQYSSQSKSVQLNLGIQYYLEKN